MPVRAKIDPEHQTLPIKTRFGTFLLQVSRKGIYSLHFPKRYAHKHPCRIAKAAQIETVLRKFIRSRRLSKMDLIGHTDFEKKVYKVLGRIPAGRTVTYGELAKRCGHPAAARAVGSAMRKNRLPILIPCHRVVPSNGGIGNFSAGKGWKKILLDEESDKNSRRRKTVL